MKEQPLKLAYRFIQLNNVIKQYFLGNIVEKEGNHHKRMSYSPEKVHM